MVLKCDRFIDELVVGLIGEWDLSSGDLIEHQVHASEVRCMALSGERIVICVTGAIQVFNITTCLLMLP